ncbi:MAG: DegV family protein [Clostridia bacterium]|nr:DegV family protein [Clostridia bacterium]
MNYIVTTDSGCDLPLQLLNDHGITPIMLCYEMNGVLCRDTMNWDDIHMFYEGMRSGMKPKTSQLNPQEYIDFWTPLLEKGLPILHICLGSGVSVTYQNGVTAADILMKDKPDTKIVCIDSTLCSTGYGMLALQAAKMRDEGSTIEECAEFLENNKVRVNTYYTTDELLYLRRSGRCSRASAIIGTALHICPILNLDAQGHLIVQERVRGLSKTVKRLHEIIGETVENASEQTLYICHSDILDQAMEFGDSLKNAFGFRDVYYTYIGAIIGSNCGPGLMAAFYFGKPRTMDGYKAK